MATKTTHAYVAKDAYKQPVWFRLVEDEDGTKRRAFAVDSAWEPLPRHLAARAAELNTAAVTAFGPAPENPAKPLGWKERGPLLLALETAVDAFCAAG